MEAAANALSRGFLNTIFSDKDQAEKQFPVPVMQCLQIKPIAQSAQGGDRYRLVMSDGDHYVQAVLAAQANTVVRDDTLKRGSIVRIHGYTTNTANGRNIMLILNLDVIESFGELEKIGEPVAVNTTKPADATATTISGNDFYGGKKEETKTQMASRPAASNGDAMGNIHPIEGLSPYSHKWTIKARVTSKSDIKRWHKQTGEGKLFSVNLLDESGEIKATGFNEQCDAFYDQLQEGSVYYISTPCRVSMAKKQFSNLPHDYELAFETGTVITKAEDQASVPQMRFNFCTIQDLQNVEKDNTVDVIGVLKEVGESSEIVSKRTGQPFAKRDLTIVDDTGFSVRVTVWGNTASSFETPVESILAFKGTKVSDFGGKSLSLLSSGTMTVDPDINDAHRLKGWYDSAGRTGSFASHQNTSMGAATGRKDEFKTIQQVKEEDVGMDDTVYYSIKATIVYVRNENFCYPACAQPDCNKKVTSMGDGTWRCEKCEVTHDKPEYRYVMSINVADHTSHQWLSCFDDTGRIIMGMSASELVELQETDNAKFKTVFEGVNCQTLKFRCRAKMDNYGGAQKIRYQVMSATPVDFSAESMQLVEMIKQYDLN